MAWTCPHHACDGSGTVVDPETRVARPCLCRPAMLSARRTGKAARSIPRRLRGSSLERPPLSELRAESLTQLRTYTDELDAHLDAGRGLWICGDPASGKSSACAYIAMSAAVRQRTFAYLTVAQLAAQLRASIDDPRGHMLDVIDSLVEPDLLILDDMLLDTASDWLRDQMFLLIEGRYGEQKAVVTASSATPEVAGATWGGRIVRRLTDTARLVSLKRAVT